MAKNHFDNSHDFTSLNILFSSVLSNILFTSTHIIEKRIDKDWGSSNWVEYNQYYGPTVYFNSNFIFYIKAKSE